MISRCREEKDVALDAAHPPVVDVLEIAAVAVAVDFDRKRVLARANEIRDTELRGRLAPLAIADFPAVHPYVHRRAHAAETQIDLTVAPALRHGERAAVRTYGVVFMVHKRGLRVLRKRKAGIDVDRNPVALELPVARHGDLIP